MSNDFWRQQREQTYAPHVAPLNQLVDALGKNDEGGRVPYIAPWYIGIEAPILAVLQDPGAGADSAAGSGFLCTHNADETSVRQQAFMNAAGIDPRRALPWNAYPWYINRKPSPAEIASGTEPLFRIVSMLPRLQFVLLHGNHAHKAWRLVLRHHGAEITNRKIRWIETYHPGRQALRTPDPQVRTAREAHLANAYALAAMASEKS